MRRTILVALLLVGFSSQPAHAQPDTSSAPIAEPPAPVVTPESAALESSYRGAYLVERRAGGHRRETEGILASDLQGRRLRFVVENRSAFEVTYDRITALHYEGGARYPRRWFNRHVEFHVVIHYLDDQHQDTFAVIRVSSNDVPAVFDALEADTGVKVDTSIRPGSFLGMPIRVAVGDKVTVTEWSGRKAKRRITRLGKSSITLEEPQGGERVVDAADVQKVRLTYSPRNDALQGFAIGGVTGALITLPWCSGMDGGECLGASMAFGAALGGFFAGLNVVSGALGHTFDQSQDVYVGSTAPIRRPSSDPRPDRSSSGSSSPSGSARPF